MLTNIPKLNNSFHIIYTKTKHYKFYDLFSIGLKLDLLQKCKEITAVHPDSSLFNYKPPINSMVTLTSSTSSTLSGPNNTECQIVKNNQFSIPLSHSLSSVS